MARTSKKPARRKSSAPRRRAGLRVSRDVVSRRLGDEVILVNLATDRVYALNQTAARFWELLASRRGLPSIERALGREFAIEGAKLSREITRLVASLEAKKLVRRA